MSTTATMKVLNTLFTYEPITGLKLSAAACDTKSLENLVNNIFSNCDRLILLPGDYTLSKNLELIKEKITPLIYNMVHNGLDNQNFKSFMKLCKCNLFNLILECCMSYCNEQKKGNKTTILKLFTNFNKSPNRYERNSNTAIHLIMLSFKSLSDKDKIKVINDILVDCEKVDGVCSLINIHESPLMIYDFIETLIYDKTIISESLFDKLFKNTKILEIFKIHGSSVFKSKLIPIDEIFEKLSPLAKAKYLLSYRNCECVNLEIRGGISLYMQYLQMDRHRDNLIKGTVQLCKKYHEYIPDIINLIISFIGRQRYVDANQINQLKNKINVENLNNTKLLNQLLNITNYKDNTIRLTINQKMLNKIEKNIDSEIAHLINKLICNIENPHTYYNEFIEQTNAEENILN